MVYGFQRNLRGLIAPGAGGLSGFQRQRLDQRKKSAGPTCTVRFGSGTVAGTFSQTAAGFRIPFIDASVSNAFAYLSTAIKPNTGKWYWEARPITTGNYVLWGLAQNLAPATYGGYSSINHGFYNLGSLWSQATVGTPWSLGAAAANDVLGFMYDSDAHTLDVSLNGVVGGQITSMASVDMYPLMAFQNGGITAGDFIFGSACAFAPGGAKFYGT
jgi:hypothetical protein